MFLIIDDDPSISTMLGWYLDTYAKRTGYAIKPALSLEDGMKLAPQASIILLDYIIPGTPKEIVLGSIEEMKKHAPVILITGFEGAEGGNDELLETAIKDYGASFVVFKSMLNSAGMPWLLLVIQAAIMRRLRDIKET